MEFTKTEPSPVSNKSNENIEHGMWFMWAALFSGKEAYKLNGIKLINYANHLYWRLTIEMIYNI